MIISKDSNNNWTPVATGNGQFVGTKVAFDAVKDDLPDNTVAYTTDDGETPPKIEFNHAETLSYTVATNTFVDVETTVDWTDNIAIIPKWLGSTGVALTNYFKSSNDKVSLTIRNVSSATITVTSQGCTFTIIRG